MASSNEDWLRSISRWKLEAAEENSSRYFYKMPSVSEVENGELCYVIGRKGAGKTAIAEHLKDQASYNVFVRSLSFKNFPFNDLYKLEDNSYTSPSQYTTIWKFVIYSSICEMMSQNMKIDPQISGDLAKHFALDVERALSQSIRKISEGGGGFTLFGSGASGNVKSVDIPNEAPWQERLRILERLIEQYIDDSVYYILFDELDEDYKDVLRSDVSESYLNLLTGLFKAIQDVRKVIGRGRAIRPVAFLRSDIYELLKDNDKNKWLDSALELRWSEGQLRNLMAFRLARAKSEDEDIPSFEVVVKNLFVSPVTRAGGARRQKHVFEYILGHTLMRPRDVISYFRECAKIANEFGSNKISPDYFSSANRGYSDRLRQELLDEVQGAIPEIEEVFHAISEVRKQVFSANELRARYERRVAAGKINTPLKFEQVLEVLFHFSIIGNQPKQHSARIFKYIYPKARLNGGEKLALHKGLLQSFQIN
ncbi:hypothetical protein V6Z69_19055 [Cereibacter sphaeroides]|uniref:P-loop ATPase, Sll1717 family n=1 Tax=Cereibacter sphaeroides TaxID=1063 RepID=UPI003990BC72